MADDIKIRLTAQDVSAGAFRSYTANLAGTRGGHDSLTKSIQASSSATEYFSRVLKGAVVGVSAKGVIDMADAWTDLQNRLRLVTTSQADLAQATNDVYAISQRTSQSVGTTASVYQRFAQNAGALGLSLSDVAKLTDTVNKAVAVSGASSQAAEAALMQFGQALASGVLRGEEFNSVMEQTPGLAQAIAKGMGVPIGKLRDLAQTGQITSKNLIAALQAASGAVDQQFSTRIKTVQQSMVELNNAMSKFAGEASTQSGASRVLAESIGFVATNLDSLATVSMAAAAAAFSRYALGAAVATAANIQKALSARANAAEELRLAQAQVAQTTATLAQATALRGLGASHQQITVLTAAHEAAVKRLTIAQAGYATAARVALGLLGGPVGLAITAASAAAMWLMFRDNTDKATQSLLDMEQPLTLIVDKFMTLSRDQQQAGIAAALVAAKEATDEATTSYENLRTKVAQGIFSRSSDGLGAQRVVEFRKAMDDARAKGESLTAVIERFSAQVPISPSALASWVQMSGQVSTADRQAKDLTARHDGLKQSYDDVGKAAQGAVGGIASVNAALAAGNAAADKKIAELARSIALFGNKTDGGEIRYEISLGDKGAFAGASEAKVKDALALADYLDNLKKQAEAQKKVNTESQKASKKSQADKEREAKQADDYIDKLRKQAEGFKEMTNVQQLDYDIKQGNITLGITELAQARELAKQADDRKEANAEAAINLEAQNAALSAQRELLAQVQQYDADLDGMSIGDGAAERMQARLQIFETYNDRIRDLEDQRRRDVAAADDTDKDRVRRQYDTLINTQQQYQTKALAEYDRYVQAKLAKESDWSVGANKAWANYLEDAANVSGQSEQAFTRAINSSEDAIVQLAVTGKGRFSSLVDSMISDLIRLKLREMMTSTFSGSSGSSLLSGLLSIGTSLLGGGSSTGLGSATAADVAAAGDGLMFLSTGGYTGQGGKNDPAGIVHAGEYVINAESTRKLGLGFLSQLNGYSEGGFVASTRNVRQQDLPGYHAEQARSTARAKPAVQLYLTNYIDSRSDQAQVAMLVDQTSRVAVAQALEEQTRGMR